MIVKHLYTKPLYFALSEVEFFLNLHCLVQIRYCICSQLLWSYFWDQVKSIHIVSGRRGSNHAEAWVFFFFLASSLLICKDNSFFWSFLIIFDPQWESCWSSCRWRLYISRVRPVDTNFSYALSSRKISRN